MKTLRREAFETIKKVWKNRTQNMNHAPAEDAFLDSVFMDMVDSLSELRGFSFLKTDEERPAYVLNVLNVPENFPLEWKIAAGQTPKQEQIDENKLIQEALNTFEQDLQLPGNWQWYAVKPAEEKIWKALREFIVKKYVENPKAFAEYQTWRTQPFASGKMSNRAIKNAPQDFEASWTDFLAGNSMYGQRQVLEKKTDVNDIPLSY